MIGLESTYGEKPGRIMLKELVNLQLYLGTRHMGDHQHPAWRISAPLVIGQVRFLDSDCGARVG
jgi:hypothetical protein